MNTFTNLLPSPLHPAVVHLPIVFALLAPVAVFAVIHLIRKGARPARSWAVASGMLAALALSAWVSTETGEQNENRVERIVPRQAFHAHEERAELFLTSSFVVLGISLVGFSRRKISSVARWSAAAGSLVLVGMGYAVGHSGGQLVYRYGAASAFSGAGATAAQPTERGEHGQTGEGR